MNFRLPDHLIATDEMELESPPSTPVSAMSDEHSATPSFADSEDHSPPIDAGRHGLPGVLHMAASDAGQHSDNDDVSSEFSAGSHERVLPGLLRVASGGVSELDSEGLSSRSPSPSPSPPSSPSSLSDQSISESIYDLADAAPHGDDDEALEAYEAVTYRASTAQGRGRVGDGITGDHIPSNAANLRAAHAAGSSASASQIRGDGLTLAVPEQVHRDYSRTYGGRNTPAQIARDAADADRARYRDYRHYGHHLAADDVLTHDMVQGMAAHYVAAAESGQAQPNRQTNDLLRHYRDRIAVPDNASDSDDSSAS